MTHIMFLVDFVKCTGALSLKSCASRGAKGRPILTCYTNERLSQFSALVAFAVVEDGRLKKEG